MFTGLIEEIGTVRQSHISTGNLSIFANTVLKHMAIGDSISVNGVCLTVTNFSRTFFTVDVTPETIRRSTLGHLHSGDLVNLERPMPADGRFGGHLVSGHVDDVGWISQKQTENNAIVIEIKAAPSLMDFIVEKGSVAVDGISLTVAAVHHNKFRVSIIPHTAHQTTIVQKKIGDPVNLETDLIGKYVHRFLRVDSHFPDITVDFLHRNGF